MIIKFVYLFLIIVFISCFLVLDKKYKIVFWSSIKNSFLIILPVWFFLIVWDFVGIKSNIFIKGKSKWMLDFDIFPEMPLEELFFLFFLVYQTLIYLKIFERIQLSKGKNE